MTTALSFWQEVILLGLLLLTVAYVLHYGVWKAAPTGSDLLFVFALSLTIASVAYPPLFRTVADALVERSPLPEALESADARVASIGSMPRDLLDRARVKVGLEPTRPGDEEVLEQEPPGPFVSNIRPSVTSLVSLSIRLTSFFFGNLFILTAIILRPSARASRRLEGLRTRVEELERNQAIASPPASPARSEPE